MKKQNKTRKLLLVLVILFVIIIVSCILFLWYALSGNYINIAYTDESAKESTISDASNSNIIIVNGIVLGGSKDSKWISKDKFYEANKNKTELEVDMFANNSMYGTFKTASLKQYQKSVIYTTIAKEGIPQNYIAISRMDSAVALPGMTKLEATDEDIKYVRDAIGSYDLINGSVKILEVYASKINEVSDKIICATCEKSNIMGAYSAVVYVTKNKSYLVKYSYVRDTKNADLWPIYSLQFVLDLNQDLKPEMVLQETTGNDTSYSVLELREDNKFYEVLRSTIEI